MILNHNHCNANNLARLDIEDMKRHRMQMEQLMRDKVKIKMKMFELE